LSVPDEGYSRNVPDEGYSRNVPDEGYSRNTSSELTLISTFNNGGNGFLCLSNIVELATSSTDASRIPQNHFARTRFNIYAFSVVGGMNHIKHKLYSLFGQENRYILSSNFMQK